MFKKVLRYANSPINRTLEGLQLPLHHIFVIKCYFLLYMP